VTMHTVPGALPAADDVTAPRMVLRDGSVAAVRPSSRADLPALRRFFHALSPESRYRRFFTACEAQDAVLERLSDSTRPAENLMLIAERAIDGETRIIAAASYTASGADCAEAAFAVADAFQGKGLGTALLERLAVLAAREGVRRFQASTLVDNARMLEVFRDSGFEIRSKSAGGSVVDVQWSLASSATSVAAEEQRHRLATVASLRPLLEPKAVAVVGASRDPASIGRRVLDALTTAGFQGPIYPVNAHAAEVSGAKAFTSVRDLPPGVDLAIVAVPAPAVPGVVDDCAAAGIKSLVVITAGFAEAGADGRVMQEQLTAQVRNHGMRMVGPNCMGLVNANPAVRLNASFSPIFPPSGHIGLLSQSGALGVAILQIATERRLGLSTFVSVGNKADVSGNDLLEYWEEDPSTRVILLYLESFGNPQRFSRLARRIARRKPIIAVKSGRTRAGSRAASSHTAALAASDVAVDALFHQAGVIRADTLDEMFDIAACLDTQPLPRGRRVGIVTNAGGPGILATDACEAAGLTLAELTGETSARLRMSLPAIASGGNPVDMIASAGVEEYRSAIETMLTASEIDSLIIIFTPVDQTRAGEIMQAIRDGIAAGRHTGAVTKPVLACVMAEPGHPVPLEVGAERVPAYAFPENAARALGKMTAYAGWRGQTPGLLWGFDDLHVEEARSVCREAIRREGASAWLGDEDVRRVLSSFGLPGAPSAVAHSPEEAAALATTTGFPVAAKLSSRRIQHKSDIGGVRLNLGDERAVRDAFDEIVAAARGAGPADAVDGVLIQPMIHGGVEVMMGITQDPLFGPLIAFGLGGIHVEILGDVRFRIAPLTDRDVDELLHEIKGFRLLQGYRGHPAADLEALRNLLLRLSCLAVEVPEVAELDLNPVIALAPGQGCPGCRIVDARIRVRSGGDAPPSLGPGISTARR
jgi:acetyl coenzyme A synthetase (ADP forming)-like protein